jgi:hypothetical protein
MIMSIRMAFKRHLKGSLKAELNHLQLQKEAFEDSVVVTDA